jgi:hypothetical protein
MEKHDPAHKFQIVGPFEVTLDSVKDLLVLARQPEAQGACDNSLSLGYYVDRTQH